MKVIRSYKRSRIPLSVASSSVVLAHAAGAGRARIGQALHGGAARRLLTACPPLWSVPRTGKERR